MAQGWWWGVLASHVELGPVATLMVWQCIQGSLSGDLQGTNSPGRLSQKSMLGHCLAIVIFYSNSNYTELNT